jgi:hypothetical protein
MRPAMAEVSALDILPNHTAKPNLWSVGNQVARAHRQDDVVDGVQD